MSHDNLKDVCRSWEGMLSNPHFYEDRTISGTSEQLVCYIKKDPKAANDNFTSFGCVITIYDPLNSTWKRLTPCIDDPHFPGSISLFSRCVAVNRKLVLITGLAPPNINVNSVCIYDFESARWRRGADMPTPRFDSTLPALSTFRMDLSTLLAGWMKLTTLWLLQKLITRRKTSGKFYLLCSKSTA